jgi:hypothetical protein
MIPHSALKQVLLTLKEELFIVLCTCQVNVEKFVLWLSKLPYTILKCKVCSKVLGWHVHLPFKVMQQLYDWAGFSRLDLVAVFHLLLACFVVE